MKTKIFVLAAISSVAMLSADQWNQTQWNQGTSSNQSQQNKRNTFQQTPRTIMDDEIAQKIHPIMVGNWMTSGYPHVTFDVNNGTVNLRGIVDTREDKNKIEQAIKKIEGVKGVKNEITVGMPTGSQKSKMLGMNNNNTHNHRHANGAAASTMTQDSAGTDQDRTINSRLRERLSRLNSKGYETLVISTSNGAVVITGNIDRVEDIQRISNEARNVQGVKSVTNQVTATKKY